MSRENAGAFRPSPVYGAVIIGICGPPQCGLTTMLRVVQAAAREAGKRRVEVIQAVDNLHSLEDRLNQVAASFTAAESAIGSQVPIILVDGFPQSTRGVQALLNWQAIGNLTGGIIVCRTAPTRVQRASSLIWETGQVPEGLPPRADEGADVGWPGIRKAIEEHMINHRTIWCVEDSENGTVDMATQLAEYLGL